MREAPKWKPATGDSPCKPLTTSVEGACVEERLSPNSLRYSGLLKSTQNSGEPTFITMKSDDPTRCPVGTPVRVVKLAAFDEARSTMSGTIKEYLNRRDRKRPSPEIHCLVTSQPSIRVVDRLFT